jgi:transposase InsO family protein
MVDVATKYPDAVLLKFINSERIAEALVEILSRAGISKEILHDQGTNFMSSVMGNFNKLLHIKSIHTSPYHAQANGLCERFNGTLKQMLKKVANKERSNWDRYLCPILFAYREVPQS